MQAAAAESRPGPGPQTRRGLQKHKAWERFGQHSGRLCVTQHLCPISDGTHHVMGA